MNAHPTGEHLAPGLYTNQGLSTHIHERVFNQTVKREELERVTERAASKLIPSVNPALLN